ncbi:MAG: type I 3-dehydroquinate dehydratase [Phycisphaerales bacterium]|jgi:3-dehydroquinate dehydratase/shikimate dehydrogenase|nr:type I 3-dehydroquinate dehydratase [Phycisphaerales bacterium]
MTLIVASVHGTPPPNVANADMIEIRADTIDVHSVPSILGSTTLPTIFTVRSVEEGGNFSGSDEQRIEVLTAALTCSNPPTYLDIEYEFFKNQPWILDDLPLGDCDVILSWHDMKGRPKDLFQKAAAMQDVAGISVVKMAWRARSLRDNLDAFELLQARQQPMIALCMGPYGKMSRILAPKFGGFATFASIGGREATADGQLDVEELRGLYNFDTINADTFVFGVIGEQVNHSASPLFHNAAFAAAGTNAVYLPFPIPAGWEHLKATTLSVMHASILDFKGASITIPHKENMAKLVAEEGGLIDKACEDIGALNTIGIGKTLSGTNTDSEAIATLIRSAKRVLILGAGGVARAAISAAINNGSSVIVVARRTEQAKKLATVFGCEHGSAACHAIDMVINCTPVGMRGGPSEEGDPLQLLLPSFELTSDIQVFDTVYDPEETPLLLQAKEMGCTRITGADLFRKQAAAQQRFWASCTLR